MLGEQILTIFLCIKRVRLNWNFIVYGVENATYFSHGAPCPARDLFPWLNTRVKVRIFVRTIREYPKRHSSYLSYSRDTFIPFLIRLHITRVDKCSKSKMQNVCFRLPSYPIIEHRPLPFSASQVHFTYVDRTWLSLIHVTSQIAIKSYLIQQESFTKMYSYTILNRIKFMIWTICAFRVLNPRHWSLAKVVYNLRSDAKKCQNEVKPKGMM